MKIRYFFDEIPSCGKWSKYCHVLQKSLLAQRTFQEYNYFLLGSSKIYNKGRLFASLAIQRFASNFKKKLVLHYQRYISTSVMLVSTNVCGGYASFKLFFRMGLMKRNMVLVLPHKRTLKNSFHLFNVFHTLKIISQSI